MTPLPDKEKATLQGSDPATGGKWKLWTVTSGDQAYPIKAKVSAVLCGTSGTSKPQLLTNGDDAEESGGQTTRRSEPQNNKKGKGKERDTGRHKDKPESHNFKPGEREEFKVW